MKVVDDTLAPEAPSKERILRAAQAVFAQKGFDGARVDEIARAAGVNKALIYYYFKSKEEILHALLHLAIGEIGTRLGKPAELMAKVLGSPEEADELIRGFIDFLRERKELLSIAVMELLKDTDRRDIILSHLAEEAWQGEAFESLGIEVDAAQARVTEFFTGLAPIVMLVLLSDAWRKLYGESEAELLKMFTRAFKETHVRYSIDRLYAMKKGEEGKE
jgi:TetR/AcrR family transcriptional regulator